MSNPMNTLAMPQATTMPELAVSSSLKGSILAGAAVIAVVFGGFGTWAALAPLDSAVIARGQLAVESKRKTIQHLEGGIVRDILVKEGDQVVAGQVLLRLDDAKARANLDMLQGQYDAALAQLARLKAERDGLPEIVYPAELVARATGPAGAVMAAQQTEFNERRNKLDAQDAVLRQRVAELNAEIDGDKVQEAALGRQIALMHRELSGLRELAGKGYYPKNKILAMERDVARLEGELGTASAAEARTRNTVAETRMQLVELRHSFREEVAKDLDGVQNRLGDVSQQLAAARDTVRRLEVVAPVAGTVQNIRVATKGGVVVPGMELMDVVPTNDRLVIDARVQAGDIEGVRQNQPAEVRFSALKGRNSPVLTGKVTVVSADRMVDPRTGQPYYAARVEVPTDQLARLNGRHIQAGMPVEVLVEGGERTLADYLLRPLTDSFADSFKER